ncbi:GNAT family N-acetyltransferase [Aquirufa ecclesiirivi]|uniref:GNAT family N-acetyltransferase n=1 Tax=Aquirufa ecclesiirivi TaxID=2715124 RepID=UPI0023D8C8D3|nr:GNAT family N-acetyltransferase [Aquirufa ecclesiirivi]MDF0693709.1 GNAT family N-acetyltransferase [Aquirufa ecclesiirivi]
MQIRKAEINDIPTIQAIAEQAWRPTYGEILSEEQCVYMLDIMYRTDVLKKQFDENVYFFMLESEEGAIGFAAYEAMDDLKGKLHKIYLRPLQKSKGAGTFLLEYVAKFAQQNGQKAIFLNVNRHNSAVQFYLKRGFQIDQELDLHVGEGYYMNDYIMKREL